MRYKITLLLLMTVLCTFADELDERQLAGIWHVEAITGDLPLGIKSFSSLIFQETKDKWGDWRSGIMTDVTYEADEYEPATRSGDNDYTSPTDEYLLDYFITNGNKLHIIIDDVFTLKLVIDDVTGNTLWLKTYDGQCSVILTKTESVSVRSTGANHLSSDGAYTLNGRKIQSGEKVKGVVIRGDGQKVMKP